MAPGLDISLLKPFGILFPFLLVFCVTYAVLAKTKVLGDSRAISALIAFVMAIGTLFSDLVTEAILRMIPWFVILFLFTILVLVMFMLFGVKAEDAMADGNDYKNLIGWWIVITSLVIAGGSFGSVLSEQGGFPGPGADGVVDGEIPVTQVGVVGINNETLSYGAPAQQKAFFNTLFHPKVLGLILLMLISMVTILRMSAAPN